MAQETLDELGRIGNDKQRELEIRLFKIAEEANTRNEGWLDRRGGGLSTQHKKYKQVVENVRHYPIMHRHRIYITGSHRDCTYQLWLVKDFKKDNVLNEKSEKFLRLLQAARGCPQSGMITADGTIEALPDPAETEDEP